MQGAEVRPKKSQRFAIVTQPDCKTSIVFIAGIIIGVISDPKVGPDCWQSQSRRQLSHRQNDSDVETGRCQ